MFVYSRLHIIGTFLTPQLIRFFFFALAAFNLHAVRCRRRMPAPRVVKEMLVTCISVTVPRT